MKQVVIIEDEQNIVELLQLHLADLGCEVISFTDGQKGFDYVSKNHFDLLILDLMLPGMNGLDICRNLRYNRILSPIMMLTARTEEIDKVLGLETGADDYITKPFSIRELLARVRAIFRRAEIDKGFEGSEESVVKMGEISVDRKRRIVMKGEKRIELTPKEFDLLFLLATNPGVTYDRKELLDKVWGYDFRGYEHTVNSNINRLRAKLEEDPNQPRYVLTTWGVGYRFSEK